MRPLWRVITHGFPVGEPDAASSPTGKPWVITRSGDVGRAARGRVSPARNCLMIDGGSAVIHAAAVTAAAWIAALPVLIRQVSNR